MLTKMVNGVEVVMSDAEEAEIRAEWDANAAAQKTIFARKPTLDDVIAILTPEQKSALDAVVIAKENVPSGS